MKIKIFVFILTALSVGCTKTDFNSPSSQINYSKDSIFAANRNISTNVSGARTGTGSTARLSSATLIANSFDYSGTVEVSIWADYIDGYHNHAEVSVDPGFVLIGGGARVTNFSNTSSGVEALLTSEYPKDDGTFSTFVADSKDHKNPYNHRLWVYAIGMRLYSSGTPLSESTVESYMNINKSISATAPHPSTDVTSPTGYTELSGGSKVNYTSYGSLLTQSGIPMNLSIGQDAQASSKDQYYSDPSTIESYSLSIDPVISGFGTLEITRRYASRSISSSGRATLITSVFPTGGWVLSGIGAYSEYTGYGRLLYEMYPANATDVFVSSKDHIVPDASGHLYSIVFMIRKL